MVSDQYIDFQVSNRCGVITLNRPQALNAVNYDMIAVLERHYRDWSDDLDIYAVVLRSGNDRAFSSGGDIRWHAGVANLGVRPTVGGADPLLEVHLFDFDEEIYGVHMRVALVEFQRPEVKFDSLEDMRLQMREDERQARMTLAWEDWDASWPASSFMAGPLDLGP